MEGLPIHLLEHGLLGLAKRDVEGDDVETDGRDAAKGRTPQVELGADLDGQSLAGVARAQNEGDADPDAHLDVIGEGLPVDQKVAACEKPRADGTSLEGGAELAARHQARRREREVEFAAQGQVLAHLPVHS